MMSHRGFKLVGSTAIAALSLAGMLAVSGCEERPYPQPAKSYAPPPSAPPAELAGAPSTYAPPAPTVYTAPPTESAPTYNAPVYSTPSPQPYGGEGLVAMAPIPNPGEGEGSYGAPHHHRVHGTHYTGPVPVDQSYAAAPVHHKPVYVAKPATPALAPKYAKAPTPPAYKAPVKPTAPAYKPAPAPTYAKAPVLAPVPPKPNTYTQKGAALGAAAGAATGVVAKDAHAVAKGTSTAAKTAYAAKATPAPGATPAAKLETKTLAVAAGAVAGAKVAAKDVVVVAKNATTSAKAAYTANKPGTAPAPATPPSASGADRSTRLASLQSALTDAISKGAKLTAPARFTANQPADVTLTVPATFAASVRDEAGKDGLSDAAASVNLTAVLSGDGFAVTPDETQSQPLTLGQITEFHWTVTAQPGAKGPLHADVGADLLGGGSDTLALGSVQKAAGLGIKLTPKVVGAALLVLIAALIVAWLARGRGGPSRPASARRASRAARNRPLDMGTGATTLDSHGDAGHHAEPAHH